jgi:uncharacterized damage-inducible protein DinB
MIDAVRPLFEHMEWADARIWTAVLAAEADQKLRETLHHLHMVQRAFIMLWRDEAFDRGLLDDHFADLAAMKEWTRQHHRDIAQIAVGLDDEALAVTRNIPWAGRFKESPAATTLGETMLQVAMHSHYHRGQVNKRLRELGAEPPLVDFIAWCWSGKPPAEWP